MQAEHHDDHAGIFLRQNALRGRSPIDRVALGLIPDQARNSLVLADDAHVGLFGIGFVEAVAEPVGHRVAEHEHIALGRSVALVRLRSARIILARGLATWLLTLER